MEWGPIELGKDKTALLVIDMQNSFLQPEGAMSKLGFDCNKLRDAIPGTERLVAAARKKQIPIIYTQYVYEPDFELRENLADLGVLGDENEPLLSLALDQILGRSPSGKSRSGIKFETFTTVKNQSVDFQRMYIDELPEALQTLKK